MTLLSLFLLIVQPGDIPTIIGNQATGKAFTVCAKMGLPPTCLTRIFGEADAKSEGRINWRENPDRYILWQFDRYDLWVEWERSPFPRIGKGKVIHDIIYGGIE